MNPWELEPANELTEYWKSLWSQDGKPPKWEGFSPSGFARFLPNIQLLTFVGDRLEWRLSGGKVEEIYQDNRKGVDHLKLALSPENYSDTFAAYRHSAENMLGLYYALEREFADEKIMKVNAIVLPFRNREEESAVTFLGYGQVMSEPRYLPDNAKVLKLRAEGFRYFDKTGAEQPLTDLLVSVGS